MKAPAWQKYAWTEDDPLFVGVCISIAVGIDCDTLGSFLGAGALIQNVSFESLDERLVVDGSAVGPVIGLLQVGDNVVMVERESAYGDDEGYITSLGVKCTFTSYYVGGHGGGRFHWYENGTVKCAFDHDMPADRWGLYPDAVLPIMESTGGIYPQATNDLSEQIHTSAAIMALQEAITGTSIARSLVYDSSYTAAVQLNT